jgi:hypothetical protein
MDVAAADTILCPYCGMRFRFDRRWKPFDADPPGSFFDDQIAAGAEPHLAFSFSFRSWHTSDSLTRIEKGRIIGLQRSRPAGPKTRSH